jgi:hypothetical protein
MDAVPAKSRQLGAFAGLTMGLLYFVFMQIGLYFNYVGFTDIVFLFGHIHMSSIGIVSNCATNLIVFIGIVESFIVTDWLS